MAAGFKTGGRVKGVPNKATVARRAPGPPDLSTSARAREAGPAFPPHRVEHVALLEAYPNNARTHTADSVDRLCALIKEFGWTNPILVAGLDILAGHRRLSAALKLGMDFVPVIDLAHLSADQRRAYILADNKSALDAGWDETLLTFELGELRDAGFDLALTGFDLAELSGVTSEGGGAGSRTDEGNVCCPSCGHEFKTVSKAFRKMAART